MWVDALQACLHQGRACVLVTLRLVEGSAPRKAGTRLLLDAAGITGTIGGGALEHEACAAARAILEQAAPEHSLTEQTFVLSRDLSQCCGGRVVVQFDYHPASDFRLVLFGAGYVGQCVAHIATQLECHLDVYDTREEWLARLPDAGLARGKVRALSLGNNPFEAVEACHPRSYYLVMTHSHEQDFELVEAILSRGDARYCGMVASRSKALNCIRHLQRKQFTEDEIAGLTAPLGQKIQTGNQPMEVAIAAISDILDCRAESQAGGQQP